VVRVLAVQEVPVEKPTGCAMCGKALVQPPTGRPRRYCGPVCRRAAEYELRRVQSLLLAAEKASQRARAAHDDNTWDKASTRRAVKFWAGEVRRLQTRLFQLLADSPQEEAEP
jgi:hypothetical protein